VLRWDAGNSPVTHFRYLSVRRVADFQKLLSLLDKTLQFAGESEDERNLDAQRLTSNAVKARGADGALRAQLRKRSRVGSPTPKVFASRRSTSATAAVQGLGVAAALVWVLL